MDPAAVDVEVRGQLSEQEAAMRDLLADRFGSRIADQLIIDIGLHKLADESDIDWWFAEQVGGLRE